MVVLVLIMTITTMMLPNQNMRKYAQFGLSILFIFFFIQPIAELFTLNLASESNQIVDSIIGDFSKKELDQSINFQKKEIQASSDAYVIEELTYQLKKEMEEEFKKVFDYQIEDIKIVTNNESGIELQALTFYVHVSETNEQISTVSPIIIDTRIKNGNISEHYTDDDLEMIHWLSEALEVAHTQIQLSREGG